jgi:hypothetical protein
MNGLRLIKTVLAVAMICCSCSHGGVESSTLKDKDFIDISNPRDKDFVDFRSIVEGKSSARDGSGLNAYVLIWPIEGNGPWYVQKTTTFNNGDFYSRAYFGGDPSKYPEDIGSTYRIVAILTDKTLDQGKLEVLPIVPSSHESNEVTVIRK